MSETLPVAESTETWCARLDAIEAGIGAVASRVATARLQLSLMPRLIATIPEA